MVRKPVEHSKRHPRFVQGDLFLDKHPKEPLKKKVLPEFFHKKPVGDERDILRRKADFLNVLKDKLKSLPPKKRRVQVAKASRVLLGLSDYIDAKIESEKAIRDANDIYSSARYETDNRERQEMEDTADKILDDANRRINRVLSLLPEDYKITDDSLRRNVTNIKNKYNLYAQLNRIEADPETHYNRFAKMLKRISLQHPDFTSYYNHFLKEINLKKRYYMQRYGLKKDELPGLAMYNAIIVNFSKRPDKINHDVINLIRFIFSREIK